MNKIFMACIACEDWEPLRSPEWKHSMHGNCIRLQFHQSCIVQDMLLGKCPVTHSGEPSTYGLGKPFKHKGIIARVSLARENILCILTDGTKTWIKRNPDYYLSSHYEGKFITQFEEVENGS